MYNLDFVDYKKIDDIDGEGIKKKKKKKKVKYFKEGDYGGNKALKQMIEALQLKKDKEFRKEQETAIRKQNKLYKLLNI